MNWQKWVLLGWLAFSTLVTIATIGKPRKPIEPGIAAASVVVTGLLAWLVVIA